MSWNYTLYLRLMVAWALLLYSSIAIPRINPQLSQREGRQININVKTRDRRVYHE